MVSWGHVLYLLLIYRFLNGRYIYILLCFIYAACHRILHMVDKILNAHLLNE